MARLTMRLLGPFDVRLDDAPVNREIIETWKRLHNGSTTQ